jgi:DNA-binding NarL/FixJ family response regulator
MVAQGWTNKEIARAISLTSRAVDAHVYRLFEKLGLRSRGDLAFWVTKHRR